jgi:hypothetical protein
VTVTAIVVESEGGITLRLSGDDRVEDLAGKGPDMAGAFVALEALLKQREITLRACGSCAAFRFSSLSYQFSGGSMGYYLPGSRKAFHELNAWGVQTIDEIPAGYPLQRIQRRVKDDVEWIVPGLQAALDTIQYPVHHLDFETLGSAIPAYPNTHPYQTIPFQWSNHIEAADGALRHEAYLCPDARDPREELAVALLTSVGQAGSICTYSGYERAVLTGLAEALPHLRRDLVRLCDRLWDLLPIIKAHYYHPEFAGSYSIKAILPAMAPHLAYADLEIQEGTLASMEFSRMVFGDLDLAEQARIRSALLNYCERDTLAMVEVRKALQAKACR